MDGLRVSDEETVEVAKMVLVGKQNKDIVLLINRARAARGRALRRRRARCSRVRKQLAAGEPTSASSARSSTWTWPC